MRLLGLAGAVIAAMAMAAVAAQAAPGISTANVNMRTGPDIEFPSVGIIPEGAPVDVYGCLNDESWCDVSWEGNRGWIFSEFLGFDYQGQVTPLPDVGPAYFGIPFVIFSAGEYWNRYYVGRPWYRDRDRWIAFRYHPRAGWRAPPPGRRVAAGGVQATALLPGCVNLWFTFGVPDPDPNASVTSTTTTTATNLKLN